MNKVTTLLPRDFWMLTPFEAGCIVSGGAHRDERDWERAAFLAANVINISGKSIKKLVSPLELLGRRAPIVPKDPGAEVEALRERARRLDSGEK